MTDVPYIYIQFAHSCTVYVGLAQARPNNIWIASVHLVYVGLAQARPNHGVCSISSVPLLTFDNKWTKCVFKVWGDYVDNTRTVSTIILFMYVYLAVLMFFFFSFGNCH